PAMTTAVRKAEYAVTESKTATEVVIRPRRQEVDPAGTERRRRALSLGLGIGTPGALLVLWQLAAAADMIDVRFFPAPTTILAEAGEMVASGLLFSDVWTTAGRSCLATCWASSRAWRRGRSWLCRKSFDSPSNRCSPLSTRFRNSRSSPCCCSSSG